MTADTSLVERLRAHGAESWAVLMDEAADRIEALTARLAEVEGILRKGYARAEQSAPGWRIRILGDTIMDARSAARALGKEGRERG